MLTPQGVISKYFYGIEFSPRDIRFGLIEASDERIGTPIDDVLLLCYHYDPATGKYGAASIGAVRMGGIATVLAIASFLFVSLRQERAPAPAERTASSNLTMFTNFPFFPQQASAQAAQVDAIYFFMVAVTAFFSLLIAALVVLFAIKYRRRSDDEVGAAIHGSLALELLWTVIPFSSRW